MSLLKWSCAGLFAVLAFNVVGAQRAQAEPLTPPTQAEVQYLEQIRRVLTVSHDPVAFRSDGELLALGRYVCGRAANGFVGELATLQSPIVTQLALIHLCPS